MKILLPVLLFACTMCNAQETFKVVDSLTHEPLPYINVNLLNGYGIYTDANGNAEVKDNGVTQVELSGLGYATKKVTLTAVLNEILLVPQPIVLQEVVVPAGKAEIKKIRAKGHQSETDMAVSRIGQEYAIYIPGTDKEAYIAALSLPLMQKDFVVSTNFKATAFKENPYSALVKVEFLPVINNEPGEERLYDFEGIMLIDGNQSPKVFDYELTEQVLLPKEGLFVKLTILGSADKNGNLVSELPYFIIEDRDGKQTRRMKQMQPNFPLDEIKKDGMPTYTRIAFLAFDNWHVIDRPLTFNPAKEYNGFTINIGYSLKMYK